MPSLSGFSTHMNYKKINCCCNQSKPLVISSRVCLARVPKLGEAAVLLAWIRLVSLSSESTALKSSPATTSFCASLSRLGCPNTVMIGDETKKLSYSSSMLGPLTQMLICNNTKDRFYQ